ncbi:endonuclease/exonuclease/phosphatase [Chimaeribacter arupi]|uniref:Endonuclease/exonuclease/phosphatase family protein n=1 Tax=Nissabacter archeti TaxID=1917880 RepID=A0ABS5JLS3_9GAMM|nr:MULTISPECIES: endonuclease/exonuclease/phosphatase family protein [Yersiniaceae]MBS0970203.1 endonuclease/exonuclease/phosphatase family protein [Nissabacter archeti]MDV5139031.1 endonuclease/exonuclease/phosphatase family protein [Chimaeribacter arupi]PLR31979.1 endonuclease/exonuclease/phosphatase [Chimaeribacter arupi]PLR45316.1 endonuclease/exonuclease/phosphatase [Chimaeribacter arupi]PLR45991.1 endonuclease/exonuclease/phosphatase [Chimaeribacter arupi]
MRLASYNVENLFDRAAVMDQTGWSKGKPVLEKFAALNELLGEITYTDAMKKKMVSLMKDLGLERSDTGPFVILRRNHGALLKRPRAGGLEITAGGRADWVGSLELIEEPVDEIAMRVTAKVMIDLQTDILAVIEAESRPSLAAFNQEIVRAMGGEPFRHVMVIDGNDTRGIDVGLMTGPDYPIGEMRSHVDDRDGEALVFSRDCPEYSIPLASGETLWVLVNHLKSKGYGSKGSSDARRRRQAERIKAIYQQRIGEGHPLIAIVGDFNDTPESDPLAPLLKETDLRDAFTHPAFDQGGYPGTWGNCNADNKLDYILLSPALWDKVKAGGVLRKGMWPGVRPVKWEAYPEIKEPINAGSDHAALWVDLDI